MSSPLPVPESAVRAVYRLQQAALRAPVLGAHQLLRAVTNNRMAASGGELGAIRRQYDLLLERELENVRQGLYPAELLFDLPLRRHARALPRFVREIPATIRRARRRRYTELPGDVDLDRYPPYYRRNFHWQADGYLSRESAEIYDVSVEFLFLGMADVMRRQVIPPLTRWLRSADPGPKRILDVACGTAPTLRQIAAAHPGHRYFGVDLSPYYVEVARERLADVPAVTLVAENAEKLPFRDEYFDVVVSVYLFHELPADARRNALREMRRVLAPGGLLVVEDSAQLSEAPDLAYFLSRFSAEMHEPYYRGYVKDDLSSLLRECGFEVIGRPERCFVAKVVAGRPA